MEVCGTVRSLQFLAVQAKLRIEAQEFERRSLRPWGQVEQGIADAVTAMWMQGVSDGVPPAGVVDESFVGRLFVTFGDQGLQHCFGNVDRLLEE